MKLTYLYREDWEKEHVTPLLPGATFLKGPLGENPDISKDTEILAVFVDSPVRKEEFDRFPNLKYVVTQSTGFDHIDLSEAKRRNILVSNVPGYGANTVAEHAFALLLTLSRRIYDAYRRVSEDGSFEQEGLRGFDLSGKTLGVVGCGAIGKHAVKIGRGFGMTVLVSDPHEDEAFAKETGATFVSLDALFAQSDVITLHTPHMPETHHMINKEVIQKMKRGVYLINTARGGLVETEALVWGLQEGIIAGAGLDVLEEEGDMDHEEKFLLNGHPSLEELKTLLANHYLIDHPRVIITPHIAFNTDEALKRILETTVENIKAFENGSPIHLVE